jgi:4-amino-4-deoxy-L-arabinose transferase-like glycosyltransferase
MRRAGVAVALATVLAAVLRIADLGGKSFWLDEAFSVALARAPWPSFVSVLRTSEANMGLYYLILRLWLRLGLTESSVRLMSAVFGIATIPVVYALGARLFGPRAGIAAAFVLALDPVHVAFSQDARGYGLAIFLAACSTWTFVHVVGDGPESTEGIGGAHRAEANRRSARSIFWAVLYIVTSAGAVYSHLYAVFVLFAQYASLIRRHTKRSVWRRLLVCAVAIGVLLLPMAAFLLGGPHGNISWIATEIPYVVLHRFPYVFALYATLILLVAWAGQRMLRSRDAGRAPWPYVLALLWLGSPIVLPILVSLLVKPVFDARYAAVAIPAIALLAGAFIDQPRAARGAVVVVVSIAAVELFGNWAYFVRFHKEDWRHATQSVLAAAAPGDAVAFYAPYVRRPYDYYVEQFRDSARAPLELYPSKEYATFTPEANPPSLSGAIARAELTAPRTWLVLGHARPDSACLHALDQALRTAYRTVQEHQFQGIEVWLYANPATDGTDIGRVSRLRPGVAAISHECPQT